MMIGNVAKEVKSVFPGISTRLITNANGKPSKIEKITAAILVESEFIVAFTYKVEVKNRLKLAKVRFSKANGLPISKKLESSIFPMG
jgi:hypothetical protein